MLSSDPHALAIAALAALGSDIAEMRGRTSKILAGTDIDIDTENGARQRRRQSKSSATSRKSNSSRSTPRSSRTLSSCSSTKSLSKASRSKAKGKAKSKSMASKAISSKACSVGGATSRRRTVMTVAPHAKPEKYVPPPRGTFRSSYTRYLRSEVIGALVSEIEDLGMPEPLPLIADRSGGAENQGSASPAQPSQEIAKRPPPTALTAPARKLKLEDVPTLALAEFDFFSASRGRATTVKETSEFWSRSPAAPAPPRVRRWLKNARERPVGTVEDVDEEQELRKAEKSGEPKGG